MAEGKITTLKIKMNVLRAHSFVESGISKFALVIIVIILFTFNFLISAYTAEFKKADRLLIVYSFNLEMGIDRIIHYYIINLVGEGEFGEFESLAKVKLSIESNGRLKRRENGELDAFIRKLFDTKSVSPDVVKVLKKKIDQSRFFHNGHWEPTTWTFLKEHIEEKHGRLLSVGENVYMLVDVNKLDFVESEWFVDCHTKEFSDNSLPLRHILTVLPEKIKTHIHYPSSRPNAQVILERLEEIEYKICELSELLDKPAVVEGMDKLIAKQEVAISSQMTFSHELNGISSEIHGLDTQIDSLPVKRDLEELADAVDLLPNKVYTNEITKIGTDLEIMKTDLDRLKSITSDDPLERLKAFWPLLSSIAVICFFWALIFLWYYKKIADSIIASTSNADETSINVTDLERAFQGQSGRYGDSDQKESLNDLESIHPILFKRKERETVDMLREQMALIRKLQNNFSELKKNLYIDDEPILLKMLWALGKLKQKLEDGGDSDNSKEENDEIRTNMI